ncbi:MAG: DNA-binding protein [Desulfovibrio sp.]|jgi:gp16 family phage-associated protein
MARTPEEVKRDLERKGIPIAAWARAHGYDADLTRRILKKERAALRGQSHNIAVSLGIKDGEIVDDREMATAINA